jgi:hypothetical protein
VVTAAPVGMTAARRRVLTAEDVAGGAALRRGRGRRGLPLRWWLCLAS